MTSDSIPVQGSVVALGFALLAFLFGLLQYYFNARSKGAEDDALKSNQRDQRQDELYKRMIDVQNRSLDIQEVGGKQAMQTAQFIAEELSHMRALLATLSTDDHNERISYTNKILDAVRAVPKSTIDLIGEDAHSLVSSLKSVEDRLVKVINLLDSKEPPKNDRHD